jgi:uncharacterized protein
VSHKQSVLQRATALRNRAISISDRGNQGKAFRWYLAAAKLGDEQSQVRIGYDYAYGISGDADSAKAIRWWKCADRQGSWDAAFNLGMYFRDRKDWNKALRWFERALRLGDKDALVEIAQIHLRYHGDRDAGLRCLKAAVVEMSNLTKPARLAVRQLLKKQKAVSKGEALYLRAEILDDRGRFAEAYPLLLKAAKVGDSSSQLMLGNYLSDGRKGVPKDPARAVSWYKRVFAQGSASGAYNLAVHYFQSEDIDEAIRWFERAAGADDYSAHLALAKIWLHERGSKAKAKKHLNALFDGGLGGTSEQERDEARVMLRRFEVEDRKTK